MELYWLTEAEILAQVKEEYLYGLNHIEQKREKRREDKKLYVRESEADRVDIHSIYTAVQTLLAINWLNQVAVEFKKRKNGDEEMAANANIMAEFDYKEMRLPVKDFVWNENKFLTGVGIQIPDDFDFTSIHPNIQNVDTLAFIFDPKGGPTIEDHRFFGIETEMTKGQMRASKYEGFDDIAVSSTTTQTNEQNIAETRGLGYTEDFSGNKKYGTYIHGTIFTIKNKKTGEDEEVKFIGVFGNDIGKILKFVRLEPVFKEERLDPRKIMFPVALNYFSYTSGDSMGISPFDLLRSKQSAYSVLFNLMLKMAYKNAMGGDRLINTEKIRDLAGLAVPTLEGKDIPVYLENWEDINNAMSYVQKDSPTNLPTELRQWLSEESILDTGIDRNSQGVLSQGSNTLGEREMAQKNANLRFLLGAKMAMWAEEFRWKYLWYRQYAANLKSVDTKEFALETGYSEDFHVFKKDDFVASDMLHLELKSKAEVEQEREQMKQDRMARYPQEIAEAQAQGAYYRIVCLQRNRMLDVGENRQRVMKTYPYTVDELNAMDKMSILKAAIKMKDGEDGSIARLGYKIDSMDEEHEVFIEFFQTLPEDPIKRRAIAMRYEAIKNKKRLDEQAQANKDALQAVQGSAPRPSSPTNSAANSAAAIASASQLGGGKTSSIGDIIP